MNYEHIFAYSVARYLCILIIAIDSSDVHIDLRSVLLILFKTLATKLRFLSTNYDVSLLSVITV